MKLIRKIWPNQTAAPNRRLRFPFVTLFLFNYLVCAPPPLSAAAGEPQR